MRASFPRRAVIRHGAGGICIIWYGRQSGRGRHCAPPGCPVSLKIGEPNPNSKSPLVPNPPYHPCNPSPIPLSPPPPPGTPLVPPPLVPSGLGGGGATSCHI